MKHQTRPVDPFQPKVGLEWADTIADEINERIDEIPLVEFIPENFFFGRGDTQTSQFLNAIKERNIPVIVHSVGLSLATIEEFRREHFKNILDVAEDLPVLSFSDHLCMTRKDKLDIGQLTTVPYNDATLNSLCDKIDAIHELISMPFAIEHIAHNFEIPNQQYTETQFINLLTKRTGCKVLLDCNNLYGNGVNFGWDPIQYVSELNLDDVDSIHMAGGFFDNENMFQDGHCEKVSPPVWDLYRHVLKKAGRPIPTVVERTGNNDEGLRPILEDMHEAQKIMDEMYPQKSGVEFKKPTSQNAQMEAGL